jgi:hypothetical protein
MIDFSHLLDFATQLPHPSDIGLIKPSGGFNIAAALCGLGAVLERLNSSTILMIQKGSILGLSLTITKTKES